MRVKTSLTLIFRNEVSLHLFSNSVMATGHEQCTLCKRGLRKDLHEEQFQHEGLNLSIYITLRLLYIFDSRGGSRNYKVPLTVGPDDASNRSIISWVAC
jgi:hypothetical protein